MKKTLLICLLVLSCCFGLSINSFAASEDLPRILIMGTMPAGTLVNIQGAGISDLISKYTPMNVKIMSVTSEEVWVPMMQTGEIDLGVAVSLTMRNAYLGKAIYKRIAKRVGVKSFPLSLVAVGSPIRIGFLVAGHSPIKKISDLKGKRVAMFAANTAFDLYTKALLANGGVNPKEIKTFPVANPVSATRAVMDRNADACMVAVDAPIVSEAVAKIGAHWLPVDSSSEAVKRMQNVIATAYVGTCPGGEHVGVPKPQKFMYLDVYLVARDNLPEPVVYEVAKTLWSKDAELMKKPMLKEWLTDRFASKYASVAYHPGAIKWYKDKGVWSQELEEMQKKLLAEKP